MSEIGEADLPLDTDDLGTLRHDAGGRIGHEELRFAVAEVRVVCLRRASAGRGSGGVRPPDLTAPAGVVDRQPRCLPSAFGHPLPPPTPRAPQGASRTPPPAWPALVRAPAPPPRGPPPPMQ